MVGGAPQKGGGKVDPKAAALQEVNKTDLVSAEVIGLLEVLTTQVREDPSKAPDQIKKAMEVLSTWQPNDIEEVELELHAELWCRLGRLAIMCKRNDQYKVALFCAEQSLNGVKKVRESNKRDKVPVTRMGWYAVAESIYGESLFNLIDESKQEKDS